MRLLLSKTTILFNRGELKAILFNPTSSDLTVERGDRLVQLLVVRNAAAEYEETEAELTPSVRGSKGFGSSGV